MSVQDIFFEEHPFQFYPSRDNNPFKERYAIPSRTREIALAGRVIFLAWYHSVSYASLYVLGDLNNDPLGKKNSEPPLGSFYESDTRTWEGQP